MISLYLQSSLAQVAKLVDALPSGGSIRKDVMVRVHSWAPALAPKKGSQFLFLSVYIFICNTY